MLSFEDILLNCVFPDLNQGKAAINEKNFQIESSNATLEDENEITGEVYVLYYILS